VVEAMTIGIPVIGLATTELATVICNGESGLVDTNVKSLIDAMRRKLRDPQEASSSEIVFQPLPMDDPCHRKPDIAFAILALGMEAGHRS